jgi:hypothetical protein
VAAAAALVYLPREQGTHAVTLHKDAAIIGAGDRVSVLCRVCAGRFNERETERRCMLRQQTLHKRLNAGGRDSSLDSGSSDAKDPDDRAEEAHGVEDGGDSNAVDEDTLAQGPCEAQAGKQKPSSRYADRLTKEKQDD